MSWSTVPDRDDVVTLVRECKIMLSRVNAILKCDPAVESLAQEDVFGGSYPSLLLEDARCLEKVIRESELKLGSIVKLE